MSLLGILLTAAAAIVAGVRRSKYDGTRPRVWWAQERMHRRPLHIIGRLFKVAFGAACLVGTFAAVLALAGVLLSALFSVVLIGATWYGLRLAARASTPRVYLAEQLDLAADDPDPAAPIPGIVLPPGTLPRAPETPGMEV